MTHTNPSQRAVRNAIAGVRATVSQRALVVMTLLVAMLCAGTSVAMSRTTHPKAKPALRVQEPVAPRSQSRSQKKSKASAKSTPATRSARTRTPEPKASQVKGKSRSHKPQPVPVDDPIPMQRASRGKLPAKPTHAAPSKRGETNLAVERMPSSMTTQDEIAAAKAMDVFAAMAPKKPAPSAVFAQGESHPDDDERLPVASVSANGTAATPAATRVSGFGAEGDVAAPRRTIAQTMAARKRIPVIAASAPSVAEQAQITEEAVQPMVIPAVYTRGGRILMPAPLKGSHEILIHQNTMADSEGLDRIEDDEALNHMVSAHLLARLPETGSLHVNEELPQNRRYARPWAVKFATDLAAAYAARFHQPLQVNSAVRTVAYQIRLMRTNGNAAPPEGATASPHLTGQALDFGKRGMSTQQIAWMRSALGPLMKAGKIDVEEEFQQACFHISVYRSYAPGTSVKKAKLQVAQVKTTREAIGPSDDSLM